MGAKQLKRHIGRGIAVFTASFLIALPTLALANTYGAGLFGSSSYGGTAPSVTTSAASSTTQTSAILNGSITATGTSSPAVRGFVYGTSTAYGATTTDSGGPFSTGPFSASISGLTCNTTYHFNAYATSTNGIGYGSDTTFTTSACSAGAISNVANSSVTASSATITWTSGLAASSQVFYGPSGAFGLQTAETNTSPRVTSHSVTLSSLNACTTYYFEAQGTTGTLVTSTSSVSSFTTLGCSASSGVIAQQQGDAPISATTTVALTNAASSSVTLTVPGAAIGTTTTFQIKRLDPAFFSGVAAPVGLTPALTHLYNLEAVTATNTVTHTFTTPLTVSMQYLASEIGGLVESSLQIQRWDGSTWTPLTACSVNSPAKTVTCTTTHFSDFALFGASTPAVTPAHSTSSNGSNGNPLFGYVSDGHGHFSLPGSQHAPPALATSSVQTTSSTPSASTHLFTRNLKVGDTGADVKLLQQFLNTHGFIIASTGSGSPSHETTRFGALTRKALIRFQEAHASDILTPAGLTKGTGYFGAATRSYITTY